MIFLLLLALPVLLIAQLQDSSKSSQDTIVNMLDSLVKDSTGILQPFDSIAMLVPNAADSTILRQEDYIVKMKKLISGNRYLNWNAAPVAMVNQLKEHRTTDSLFYILLAITAVLGFLRFFYTRYFNNLFRVFFNASLRQSQLTDQLLQAKLPALFFNLLFFLTGGVFIYLLLKYYNWIDGEDFWKVLFYCFLSLTAIYIGKFLSLKFTGWLTGYKEITNTYVFIIFLINKILGVLLLPFTIIVAFSKPSLVTVGVILSLLLISLMFLLRFLRSYGLLQHQLKIKRFHFFMYVVGIEIIPLLLIYKGLVLLLSEKL